MLDLFLFNSPPELICFDANCNVCSEFQKRLGRGILEVAENLKFNISHVAKNSLILTFDINKVSAAQKFQLGSCSACLKLSE
jgi:hypothetical protein